MAKTMTKARLNSNARLNGDAWRHLADLSIIAPAKRMASRLEGGRSLEGRRTRPGDQNNPDETTDDSRAGT